MEVRARGCVRFSARRVLRARAFASPGSNRARVTGAPIANQARTEVTQCRYAPSRLHFRSPQRPCRLSARGALAAPRHGALTMAASGRVTMAAFVKETTVDDIKRWTAEIVSS